MTSLTEPTPAAPRAASINAGLKQQYLETAVLLGPPVILILVLFLVPLAQVAWGSVFTPHLTLANYARIVKIPLYIEVFWRTLQIAAFTTCLCIVLGYPAAYLISTVNARTRQVLLLFVVVPFFLSMLIRNYIWIALLERSGVVNHLLLQWHVIAHPLPLMYNEFGVLVTMTNMLLPYTIFPILSALLAIPPELRSASASLGAGDGRTFVRVTLPLSMPGVAAGGLLVFIVALGFFITPALVGGPKQMMISNLIAFNVREVLNWPFAYALSNMLLCGTLVIYVLYVRYLESRLPRSGVL